MLNETGRKIIGKSLSTEAILPKANEAEASVKSADAQDQSKTGRNPTTCSDGHSLFNLKHTLVSILLKGGPSPKLHMEGSQNLDSLAWMAFKLQQ